MFDVGKWYKLTMMDGNKHVISSGWQVTKVDRSLVEFRNIDGRSRIINTAGSAFIEAKLSENQSGKRPVLALPELGLGAGLS